MPDLTQARLAELFTLDANAGVLVWRVRPTADFINPSTAARWTTRFAGKPAGGIDAQGYHRICIDWKPFKTHRLIWIYVNGDIPAGMHIDHVNGKRDDNRLSNLRLVTHVDNHRNRSMSSNNTSGVMGVSWHKSTRKWTAQIRIDGRDKHLGSFATLESAAEARANAEREFGFHIGHGKALDQQHD